MNKKIIVIAIILILIVITLGVVLGLMRKETREETKQPIAATTTPAISEDINISHWETYRNEEFGFEFRHPSEKDGWIYRSPAYRKFTSAELEAYKLELMKYKNDQWVYQTKDNPFGPYYVFGTGIQFEGDWSILVAVMPRKIDDILTDKNYGTREHWDVKNREKIMLENGLIGEKITWTNDMIHFYIQEDDNPLTITFTGYNEEERRKFDNNNKILLKIISSFKFTGN